MKDIDIFTSIYWYRGQKSLNQTRSYKTRSTGDWYSNEKIVASTYTIDQGYFKRVKLKKLSDCDYLIFDFKNESYSQFKIDQNKVMTLSTDTIVRRVREYYPKVKVVFFKNIKDSTRIINNLTSKICEKEGIEFISDINNKIGTTMCVIDNSVISEEKTIETKNVDISNFNRINIPIRVRGVLNESN